MTKTLRVETVAQAYLELLRDRGIDCFFANAGTDFASIVDAFARFQTEGKTTPRPIAVPHEFVAVSMAHGYYLVTGRPQVVMVHVTVGTANGAGAVINASRTQVPVLFTAGRTPITEDGALAGARDTHIHWAQEAFDQAGMLREYVKWDYELRQPAQLEAVVDRALELAMAEPRGPVYLTLPREVLAQPLGELTIASPARRQVESRRFPDPARIEEAAERLARARNPLIVTAELGRSRAAVDGLVALADAGAFPVLESSPAYVNFPAEHPCHVGWVFGSQDYPGIAEADVVLGRRLRRPVVPGSLAAGRRRHRDPARRGSVLLAVPDAVVSLRHPAGRRSGGGPAAARGRGPWPRRLDGGRGARGPGSPRRIAASGRRGPARRRRRPSARPSASSGPRGASARCSAPTPSSSTSTRWICATPRRSGPGPPSGRPTRAGSAGLWARRSARSSGRRRRPSSRRSATERTSSAHRRPPTSRRRSTSSRS